MFAFDNIKYAKYNTCDALRDLVPFVQFKLKIVKNTHRGVLLLV